MNNWGFLKGRNNIWKENEREKKNFVGKLRSEKNLMKKPDGIWEVEGGSSLLYFP